MRRSTIALVAVAVAFGAAACGEDVENGSPPADPPPAATQQPAEPSDRYADDDPEALLAIIDNGGSKPSDSDIDPYARLLDKMERFCRETRSLLADQVVTGTQILRNKRQLEYTNLELARAYSNALTGELGREQKCSDLFAGVLAMTTEEE